MTKKIVVMNGRETEEEKESSPSQHSGGPVQRSADEFADRLVSIVSEPADDLRVKKPVAQDTVNARDDSGCKCSCRVSSAAVRVNAPAI